MCCKKNDQLIFYSLLCGVYFLSVSCLKVPRLGTPMRLVDLAFFVAEHDDHHLAQITFLAHQ